MTYTGPWEKRKLCLCGAINGNAAEFCCSCAKEDSMTLEKVRRRVLEKVSGGFWGCDWAYEVYEKFADPIVEISRNKFYYGDF